MDDARKKLRVFMVVIVLAAVLVGLIYYFTDVYGAINVSEGTLVRINDVKMRGI